MGGPKTWALHGAGVVLLLVLAGCTGGSPAAVEQTTFQAPDAEFDADKGAIVGQVLSDEQLPVEGVSVGLTETGASAVTDPDGRFTFSQLAPGTYTLAWVKLGYESGVQRVEVLEGQAAEVQLSLVPIPVREPYHTTFTIAGYFQCTWRHPQGSGPCFFVGLTNDTTGNPGEQIFPNNNRKWDYAAEPGVMTVINEVEWTANSLATGGNLRIFLSYADRTTAHTYCQADGFSPLQLRYERPEADADGACMTGSGGGLDEMPTIPYDEGQLLQTFVSVGATQTPAGGLNAALSYEQRFDIWFSLFYWEKAPDPFTAAAA